MHLTDLSFVQCNLQNSRAATALMFQTQFHKNIPIALLQDCHINRDNTLTGSTTQNKIYNSINMKATIVYNGPLTPTLWKATQHTVSIVINCQDGDIFITSAYFPPSTDIDRILPELDYLRFLKFTNIIIGGDFNASSSLWGSPIEDSRSAQLLDFVESNRLVIINDTNAPPTFQTIRAKGWPDVTIASESIARKIGNWTVTDWITLSDHNAITFTLHCTLQYQQKRRFKTNYGGQNKLKRCLLPFIPELIIKLDVCNSAIDLDEAYDSFIYEIITACHRTFKTKQVKIRNNASWWTPDLAKERKILRKQRRQAQAATLPEIRMELFSRYKKSQALYKKHINYAKETSWKNYCTRTVERYGNIFHIAMDKVFRPTLLPSDILNTAKSPEDTIRFLLTNIFQKDTSTEDTTSQAELRSNFDNYIYHKPTMETHAYLSEANTSSAFNPPKHQDLTAWIT
ncbi:uncharacterized protein LOC118196462 [Stegodyphus dumicola]|uniref:uncharacterized protein LOC118196462 n=1 Tax=Stegodyphus dumicola TaxID=202533 RepID=UPI0015AF3092|nr:uncharacterized protein LOC118196462 [Stegodyphus dumicola]